MVPPTKTQTIDKNTLEQLEQNFVPGDLSLTDVPRIRTEVNTILKFRAANGFRPLSEDQAKIFENQVAYLKTGYPTLFKEALSHPDLNEFLVQLNNMLVLIEKTKLNQLDYKSMTRMVGQQMFDKYVKTALDKDK